MLCPNIGTKFREPYHSNHVIPRLGHTMMKNKRGRQKKRLEDNIKEWTGMDFARSIRAVENRTRWKGIVANLSVVPRRPSKIMG